MNQHDNPTALWGTDVKPLLPSALRWRSISDQTRTEVTRLLSLRHAHAQKQVGLAWVGRALYEGVVGHDVGVAARLAHGVVRLQRLGAVLALDAHIHQRSVGVHVALHAAAHHLAEQRGRPLQVLWDQTTASGLCMPGNPGSIEQPCCGLHWCHGECVSSRQGPRSAPQYIGVLFLSSNCHCHQMKAPMQQMAVARVFWRAQSMLWEFKMLERRQEPGQCKSQQVEALQAGSAAHAVWQRWSTWL